MSCMRCWCSVLVVILVFDNCLVESEAEDVKSYKGYKVYEITPKTMEDVEMFHSLTRMSEHFDFWKLTKDLSDPSTVMVPPKYQKNFETLLNGRNISYTTVMSDVDYLLQSEQFLQQLTRSMVSQRSSLFNSYQRFDDINRYIDGLATKYPNMVHVENRGKSHEGRDIKTIRISNGDTGVRKKTIFIDAGIHAREWIAPATALYVINQLVENSTSNKELLNNIDWIILPVVNPDGYEYSHTRDRFWRKTRRREPLSWCTGVDGNRNFDFHWGEIGASSDRCSETYKGHHAFSEPETVIVKDILLSLREDCKFYLTLHSHGKFILYPWGFTNKLPKTWQDLDQVAKAGADAIRQSTGTLYTVGSSTNVLYAAAGGSDDYAMGVTGIPVSITMELPSGGSLGFDPPPSHIRQIVKESWIGIKAMAMTIDQKYN